MRFRTAVSGLLVASGVLLVALVALTGSRDTAAVVPFAPGGALCFENFNATDYHPDADLRDAGECDGDPSPSAASDFRTKFCLSWNDDCTVRDVPATDANFHNLTGFLPLPTVIKPSNQFPVGALAGALSADSTLGVLGNPCNIPIAVNFSLMNASTNINSMIFAAPIGLPDPMYGLAYDGNVNGLPDGADLYPSFLRSAFDVDHNFGPDGIPNTSLTPTSDDTNGPIPPLQPIVRLFGATKIFGGWVTVNFLVFQPGVTVLGPDRTPVQLDPDLGYPTAVVLQDPTVPPAPAPVSDFCAPLRVRYVAFGLTHDNPCTGGLDTPSTRANCPSEQNTAFENTGYPMLPCESASNVDEDRDGKVNDGCPQVNSIAESGAECDDSISNDPEDSTVNDGCPQVGDIGEHTYLGTGCSGVNEGSCVARQNPPQAGTAPAVIYARSLRDADGDGIENTLDICSLRSNPGWNPRAVDPANDSDNDGLPNVCDPQPTTAAPQSPAGCQLGIVGADHDQDCYSNRQDNCPTANQLKDPSRPPSFTPGFPQPTDNTPQMLDRDGDAIGDACDVTACVEKPGYTLANCQLFGTSQEGTATDGVGSQDGDYATDCLTFALTVGVGAPPRADGPGHNADPNCAFVIATPSPPATPAPTVTPSPTPGLCNQTADFDCDGVYTSAESPCGSDPLDGTRRPERLDGVFHGKDDDGDTLVDEWLPPSAEPHDCDGDGFTGAVEKYLYAPNLQGDQDPCGTNNYPPTVPPSAVGWPADLKGGGAPTSSNRLDIVDLATFVVPVRLLDTDVGTHPGDIRWDLVPGSSFGADINIADMAVFFSGATGSPPMLGGQRAFGKACAWGP